MKKISKRLLVGKAKHSTGSVIELNFVPSETGEVVFCLKGKNKGVYLTMKTAKALAEELTKLIESERIK